MNNRVKVVVFDWDGTLADDGTVDLFAEAKPLLNELLQANVRVCILTGRPGRNPTEANYKSLLAKTI